jgi:glycosyltransferase involved in cell wall biosynthesis
VSGGYLYNRYLMDYLRRAGLKVTYHAEPKDVERFDGDDTVIVDSLVIGSTAEKLLRSKSNLILLLHMIPDGAESLIEALCRRSRIVVTGDSTLTTLRAGLARVGIDAVKVEPGVPAYWRRKSRYASVARRLLTVANYIDGKGIERVLDALSRIKDLPWTWTAYGNRSLDPSYFAALTQKVADYGLRNRVRLCGPISHDAVNAEMIRADLLVHLSDRESYSMVTAEAIAAGLPVLSHRTGNYRAFGQSGLVRYVEHSGLAADELGALIDDRDAYGKLRRAGQAVQRTWEHVGREFLDWLCVHS